MIRNLTLLSFIYPLLQASIDLYLSQNEVKRLLGVTAEMKYITDGVVNSYSSKFLLRVMENISEVSFTWRSTVSEPKYVYTMHTEPDDGVLPVIRIPRQGFIPNKTEEFIVEYRCSKSGQFEVALHISISYPSKTNWTNLVLKQQKLCSSHEKQFFPSGGKGHRGNSLGTHDNARAISITGENVFYMVIGCVSAVVFVIAVLLIIYFKSNRKSHPRYRLSNANLNETLQQRGPRNLTNECSLANSDVSYLLNGSESQRENYTFMPNLLTIMPQLLYEKPFVVDIASTLNELHVDKKCFQVLPVHEIEGTFGELKWAIWRKNSSKSTILSVDGDKDCVDEVLLVKALKTTADRRQLNIFLEQALRFHHLPRCNHFAQVEAAAFCGLYDSRDKIVDSPLICYKHQGYGNLKRFLQRCRSGINEDHQKTSLLNTIHTLRTHELVSMGIQILKAVVHLHKYSVLHKDIATRNCLVSEVGRSSERFFVQLYDSALSKDLFPNDYHCLGDNNNRPVKWMAYEALKSNIYTSATDAWSFGVTLWELLSCGQQPYVDVDPEEIVSLLLQGHRLSQPYNCPDELYSVMHCCWQLDYRERPTCNQLLTTLQNFELQLRKFI